jgi:large subunit ribosomal protein L36
MEIVFKSSSSFEASGREESAMKARNSIRSLKRRPGSVVVRRRGKVFVINRAHPRWKARQG